MTRSYLLLAFLVFFASLFILVPLGFVVLTIYSDMFPPELFPIDDKSATYKIVKTNQGLISDDLFYVEYSSKDGKFNRVIVGESKVNLYNYLNQKINLKSVKFVYTNQQCILHNCTQMIENNELAAIDIYSLK